ncbi:MAG: FKBP-type peptidyl-prolyl cis-trans isomerase [Chloroflexi bacterium]|nr:FKBP-type peptidyl-prolyl cis-trans isomerase [Chloroflexota bacterium]
MTDTTKFDSSLDRGRTPSSPLGQAVIRWLMKVWPPCKWGGTRLLVIPSNLAYGDAGQGQSPGATPHLHRRTH